MHRKYWFYSITFAVILTELFALGLSKASSWQDSEWQAELDDTGRDSHARQ